jgi:hypothetical protein
MEEDQEEIEENLSEDIESRRSRRSRQIKIEERSKDREIGAQDQELESRKMKIGKIEISKIESSRNQKVRKQEKNRRYHEKQEIEEEGQVSSRRSKRRKI